MVVFKAKVLKNWEFHNIVNSEKKSYTKFFELFYKNFSKVATSQTIKLGLNILYISFIPLSCYEKEKQQNFHRK